jgi:hypothetical protein
MTEKNTQQVAGLASDFNRELEALKKENETLLARNNRLELPVDCKVLRTALANMGLTACESDEQLMHEWPRYARRILRKLALVEVSV